MTTIKQEEQDKSPVDHDQDKRSVSEPAVTTTTDEKQQNEEPLKKRQRPLSDTAPSVVPTPQTQLHVCKQEPEYEMPPTASIREQNVKSLNDVASDQVVKQEARDPSSSVEQLQESSCAVAAAVIKKEKEQEHDVLEVILEWDDYRNYDSNSDRQPPTLTLSVDQMLKEGKTLSQTDAVNLKELGEWRERSYTMKIVQKSPDSNPIVKQEDSGSSVIKGKSKDLASIYFYWWEDEEEANLMNFNQMSQEMANFCYVLWRAARRNRNHYDDMSIEFGDSPYSGVPLNELIDEAINDGFMVPHVTYINSTKSETNEHGKRLMDSFVRFVGEDSNLIAHKTDFSNLKIYIEFDDQTRQFIRDYERFEFHELLVQKKEQGWFVRAGEPDLI